MERTHEVSGARGRHPALRLEVMAGGQCIAARRFERQRTVSLGRSLDNTVILADEHAPNSLDLFHRSRSGYALHFTDASHGSVALAAGEAIHDLSEVRGAASPHRHGYDLDLEEGARGHIELGDETVEFEVVAAADPPSVARDWWAITRGVAAAAIVAGLAGATVFTLTRDAAPAPVVVAPAAQAPRAPAVATPTPPANAPTMIAIEKPFLVIGKIPSGSRRR